MQAHQQRVVTERIDLVEKIQKLRVFLESDIFIKLDGREQIRLKKQLDIMKQYDDILNQRIEAFD